MTKDKKQSDKQQPKTGRKEGNGGFGVDWSKKSGDKTPNNNRR